MYRIFSSKQRSLDSSRRPRRAESLCFIGANPLSGNIHEELRGVGVCVIGMVVGKTTCIDTQPGVCSSVFGNFLRLSFFCRPHFVYLYKNIFPEISFETTGVPWLLAGRGCFFVFCFSAWDCFSRRYQALLEARFRLRRENSLLC